MSFPRYPEYKASGVEWLGEVPARWEVARLRFAAALNPSKSEVQNLDPSTLVSFLPMEAIGDDGTLKLDRERPLHELTQGYTYFREGDVTLAKITPCYENGKGAVMTGLRNGVGFGTTELIVTRPKPEWTESAYLHYLFISSRFRALGESHMYGAGGQKRVPDSFVRDFITAWPLVEEQRLIAAFLDRETAKIDALVAEQRRLMELLKEKRQAVISHAVTKGLTPDAPMKDSGVEWLGDVPTHWTIMPLIRATATRCDGPFGSGLKSEHYTDAGVRVVRLQNIKFDGFSDFDAAHIDADYYAESLSGHDVVEGDLLIAGLGDDNHTVGRTCVAPVGIEPAMVKADCFRFRLKAGALPKFISHQLNSGAKADAGMLSTGTTRSRIPLSSMGRRCIALPSPQEQEAIVSFVETTKAQLDQLMEEARQGISLLLERRTVLISAAVTGQIDVRGLASEAAA
jgi:type I restriction enzyme S subunit